MLDRQKVEVLLTRRFPGATQNQIAAAANGIMGLEDEWEEVHDPGDVGLPCERQHGCTLSMPGREDEWRFFRRRQGSVRV